MKYSISESARKVGITRKTFYKHIDKKGISVEKDQDGNPLIDASELVRVYGDQFTLDTPSTQEETPSTVPPPLMQDASKEIEIALLKERITHLEEQREHFESLYQQERTERQTNTRLLTDEREKQQQWQKSFADLQSQVIASQQNAKQELDEFKLLTKRKLVAYKRALEKEKSRGLLSRLIGSLK